MVFGQVVDDLWGEPIDATATLGTQDHRSLAGFANQGFQPVSYTHLTLPTTPYV